MYKILFSNYLIKFKKHHFFHYKVVVINKLHILFAEFFELTDWHKKIEWVLSIRFQFLNYILYKKYSFALSDLQSAANW
jgi:hypothetical protein